MNAKIRVTLHYFLSVLEKRLAKEKQETVNPIFLQIFTKEELVEILARRYHGKIPKEYNPLEMSSEEILDAIASERSILLYILELWDKEKEKNYLIDTDNVESTLKQLGLQTHYLADKPIPEWDNYDKSNFLSLLKKTGKLTLGYGIFDASVAEQDKHICSSPAKAYESLWEAQMMLNLLIAQGGFCEGELKIMKL